MNKLLKNRPFNIFLGVLTLFIWGYAYIVIRVTVKDGTIPPMSLAFMRFVVGWLALLPFRTERGQQPDAKDNRLMAGMGLTGLFLYFYFEHTGLIHTSATNASILISLAPALTALGSAIFFSSKLSWKNGVGLTVAFAGGALIIWNGKVNFDLNPLGDILILLSAVAWTAYTLIGRDISRRLSPIIITRKITVVGIFATMPFFIAELVSGKLSGITPASIAGVFYLGALCHALAFTLWVRCMDTLGIIFTTNLIYLQCVITMVIAWLTLGEPITAQLLVYTAAVLSGVYLANLTDKKSAAAKLGTPAAPGIKPEK
ncbi:MAG TPA: DMT family transporter [bacterium]|nr:DMT family transporter [bacterium]